MALAIASVSSQAQATPPPFPVPTVHQVTNGLPWTAVYCLLAAGAVIAGAMILLLLVWVLVPVGGWPFSKLLLNPLGFVLASGIVHFLFVVILFPVLEEIGFRWLLTWVWFHEHLHLRLMTAFIWSAGSFVVFHAICYAWTDPGRILDAVNLGVFNTVMLLEVVLVGGFPLWQALLFFALLHVGYNLVATLLSKVYPLLLGIRVAALLVVVIVYWYGLNELRPHWPW